MRTTKFLVLAASLSFAAACKKSTPAIDRSPVIDPKSFTTFSATNTKLLFKTDFQTGSSITAINDVTDDITGDNSSVPGYPWNTTAGNFDASTYIQYQTGTTADRKAYILLDDSASTPNNNILKFSITNATEPNYGTSLKQRVQYCLYNYKDTDPANAGNNLNEFYSRVKIKLNYQAFNNILSDTSLPLEEGSGNWVTLFEAFNGMVDFNDISKAYRVHINLMKSVDKKHLVVALQGQKGGATDWVKMPESSENWEVRDPNFYIQPGKWYTYEIYLKEGTADASNPGYAWMKIAKDEDPTQRIVVGSVTQPRNLHNSANNTIKGWKYINPIKLYTSDKVIASAKPVPVQTSYDDWALYSKFPYGN